MRYLFPLIVAFLISGCDLQSPEGSDPDLGRSADGQIIVHNETSVSVTEVNLSPCSDDVWGGNDLNSAIPPGDSHLWDVDAGCWDLRASNSQGSFATRFGVEVRSGRSFTWSLY